MPNPARGPAQITINRDLLAARAVVAMVALAAGLGTELRHRWGVLRRSRDRGVESVELAIGIALGLALALVVWAAYETLVKKYLIQAE